MSVIFSKFANKSNLDINSLYFTYEGKLINKEKTLSELTKGNSIKILVTKINDNNSSKMNISKIKYNLISCTICNENIIIRFNGYFISLSNCRNGHEIKNIKLNEFEERQKYDMELMICQNCEKTNKAETAFNEFYKCLICDIYLCPFCKSAHDKTHNIINIDKNFTCSIHNEPYSLYCETCRINICAKCYNENHKNHQKLFFKDIMPDKDDINNKLKQLKDSIELFKKEIDKIISRLNKIVNNLEIFYKINEDILKNYKIKDRNYKF